MKNLRHLVFRAQNYEIIMKLLICRRSKSVRVAIIFSFFNLKRIVCAQNNQKSKSKIKKNFVPLQRKTKIALYNEKIFI